MQALSERRPFCGGVGLTWICVSWDSRRLKKLPLGQHGKVGSLREETWCGLAISVIANKCPHRYADSGLLGCFHSFILITFYTKYLQTLSLVICVCVWHEGFCDHFCFYFKLIVFRSLYSTTDSPIQCDLNCPRLNLCTFTQLFCASVTNC